MLTSVPRCTSCRHRSAPYSIFLSAFIVLHSYPWMRTQETHGAEQKPPVVSITLKTYWHETITKEEAIARLRDRSLDDAKFETIVKNIPATTEHYLSFDNGFFREFARYGDGTTELLLLLPIVKKGDKYLLVAPGKADIRADEEVNVKVTTFEFKDGTLIVDGVERKTFQLSNKAVDLEVDASVIGPQSALRDEHPHGSPCCDSCEWVHSRLGIHHLDKYCCLGRCPM